MISTTCASSFLPARRRNKAGRAPTTCSAPSWRRQLNTEHFVMLVHSFEPIGQPAAAGFQKNKTQLGKTVEHAFTDDHRERNHLLEWMAEKMRVKKFIDALGAGGIGAVTAEEHVDADRDV